MEKTLEQLEAQKSRFDIFKDQAQMGSGEEYQSKMKGNGSFDYRRQVDSLIQLSNQMNGRLLIYLFGFWHGQHLADLYYNCDRNLLTFFSRIDSEYRFFILYELKTNESLFAHC